MEVSTVVMVLVGLVALFLAFKVAKFVFKVILVIAALVLIMAALRNLL
jgi:hypothetical protein